MSTILSILLFIPTGCKQVPVHRATDEAPPQLPVDLGTADVMTPTDAAMAQMRTNFERVHFAVDSTSLDPQSQDGLAANAEIMADFPRLTVEVQGHADERGTVDYNLALGQRRGNAVFDFLVTMGVSPQRLTVVSFGEEQPRDHTSGETAWAANRRAEFRILDGAADRVVGTVRDR